MVDMMTCTKDHFPACPDRVEVDLRAHGKQVGKASSASWRRRTGEAGARGVGLTGYAHD